MNVPVAFALFNYAPFYLLFVIITVLIVGLWEFTKNYGLPFKWHLPLRVVIGLFAYTGLLTFSAIRALVRGVFKLYGWEKTLHLNTHRESS